MKTFALVLLAVMIVSPPVYGRGGGSHSHGSSGGHSSSHSGGAHTGGMFGHSLVAHVSGGKFADRAHDAKGKPKIVGKIVKTKKTKLTAD